MGGGATAYFAGLRAQAGFFASGKNPGQALKGRLAFVKRDCLKRILPLTAAKGRLQDALWRS
jgi:hypothetical protein